MSTILPDDSAERKKFPVYSGFVKYFPDAMVAVAKLSYDSNLKHSPNATEVTWNRAASGDELEAMMRHVIEEEWVAVAWRAMANLQKQIEKEKADEESK